MAKLWLTLVTCIWTLAAFSAETHHGHEIKWDEHTQHMVGYQVVNFTILVVLLTFLLKNKVREFFRAKKEAYLSAAQTAKSARVVAETEYAELQSRIVKLSSTSDETISRAKAEAAELRQKMTREAEENSERLKKEASEIARLEVEKAIAQLKQQLADEALTLARAQISSKVSSEDHQRLQVDFIENIKGVQP